MLNYLNIENIEQSNSDCEWHPLRPFLPKNGRGLFLGSFPTTAQEVVHGLLLP